LQDRSPIDQVVDCRRDLNRELLRVHADRCPDAAALMARGTREESVAAEADVFILAGIAGDHAIAQGKREEVGDDEALRRLQQRNERTRSGFHGFKLSITIVFASQKLLMKLFSASMPLPPLVADMSSSQNAQRK
jgi:hypothetical protein